MASGLKIAIVGGGLAGLAAAMKIAEGGHEVDLISVVPVKRSHSVCAQGGINGAVNTKGEGDSPAKHLDDTVYGGDFLANQPPVKRMCDMAPQIIYLFDRMGVPFSRTREGLLDFRRFGGTLHHRTAFAGASTGQQLLYALDEQVRKWEVQGKVNKYEGWEMMSLVLDDHQVCRGLIAMDLQSLRLKEFKADAVIVATGGPGLIFGKSTNSMTCTGSAVSACYQQGARYANGEFIQLAAPYSLVANTCNGKHLNPNASCTVAVRLQGTSQGTKTDSFNIPSNDIDTPNQTVAVTGIVEQKLGVNPITKVTTTTASCTNQTTGQVVQINLAGATSLNCETAGMTPLAPNSIIVIQINGTSQGGTNIGGVVKSMGLSQVTCQNLTTGANRTFDPAPPGPNPRNWNCVGGGWTAAAGNSIRITVRGPAD